MAKKSIKRARKSPAAGKPANQPPATNAAEDPQRSSAPPGEGGAVVKGPGEVAPVADAAPAQPPPHLLTPLAEVWPTPTGPEPSKPVQKPSAPEAAPTPAAPGSARVSFVLLDLDAKQVSVCGDFNGWAPGAAPMKRDAKGLWSATLDLAPGRYQYKFVVDGQWIPDPRARDQVWNCHGTLNSLIEVRA